MKKTKNFPFIIKLLSDYKNLLVIAFIAALGSSLSAVFATQIIGKTVDYMIGFENVNFTKIMTSIVYLAFIYIVGALSSWLVSSTSGKIGFSISKDLRITVFRKTAFLPLSYFDTTPHGDIVSRFTNNIDSISDALSLSLVSLLNGLVTVVSVFIIMVYYNWKLALVVLAVTPLNFIVVNIVTKASQTTFVEQQEIVGDLSGFVTEMIGNQKVLNTMGYQKQERTRFHTKNQNLYTVGKKAHFASAMVNPSTRVVDHFSYIAVGIIGGLLAMSDNSVSIGVISMFLMYSGQFSKPFNDISGILSNLQTASASLHRVQETLNEIEEEKDSPNAKILLSPKGKIEFDHVDFSYLKGKRLIEDLNIFAKKGDLVAIVGPTGAGKTTIVNLLMRFYEINKGTIKIDNRNIKDYTKDSYRKSFGMVLQETWIYSGTISENIAYGNSIATKEDIVKAARLSHAHGFIQQMPDGYDTLLSEDGGNLSGGQKQLLTIARVMLSNPSMLILDEATSSIDSLTEKRVQKAFLALMEGRTSFVIAHRLSTIIKADTILVLDKGRIIETGTHTELLDKKGFYYSLYQSQFQ